MNREKGRAYLEHLGVLLPSVGSVDTHSDCELRDLRKAYSEVKEPV